MEIPGPETSEGYNLAGVPLYRHARPSASDRASRDFRFQEALRAN